MIQPTIPIEIHHTENADRYLTTHFVKIKQDDGSWKKGFGYVRKDDPKGEFFVRTSEQLKASFGITLIWTET